MVVRKDERGGIGCDRGFKNLARVNQNGIESSLRYRIYTNQSPPRVKQHDLEGLNTRQAVVLPQQIGNGLRRIQDE